MSVECLLYADDLKIYSKITNEIDCLALQENLRAINDWCISNNLPLNVSKCNVMSYTTKQHTITYNYCLGSHILARPDTFCDLGIIFDKKLSFTNQIVHVTAKTYKSLGFIIRNTTNFQNINAVKLLYTTLVRSHSEYASIIWCPKYRIHIDNLEKIQRRFLKYLYYKIEGTYPPIGYPQAELLTRYSIDSLEDRRTKAYLIFLYNLLRNNIDCQQILNMLNFHVPRPPSRLHNTFYLPATRTNVKKYSPLHNMCNFCNNLHGTVDIFSCNLAFLKNL